MKLRRRAYERQETGLRTPPKAYANEIMRTGKRVRETGLTEFQSVNQHKTLLSSSKHYAEAGAVR